MLLEIFLIFLIVPIMFIVQKIRGQIKPRIKAWLIAKAQTRQYLNDWLNDPFAGLFVIVFTNSMFVATFIFAEIMTMIGIFPSNPSDWVQLYAITFATLVFGAIFPIVIDAREGRGIFAEVEIEKLRR
jgi:hypothetical protein